MPDPEKPTEPQIDFSRLEASTKAAVVAGIAEASKNAPRPVVVQQSPPQAQQPDPVGDVINPYLAPVARLVNLKADSAIDAATFYATVKDAAPHSAEIEAKFNECVQKGMPMNRISIWQWMQGANIDKIVEQRIKNRDAEIEAARQAQTLQGSRGGVPTGGRPSVDINATDDELASAVHGLEF